MDRLSALRGTPAPSAAAPSPTTSQKDAAEANDFFAALAGGADNITDRRRPTAPAPKDAEPVDKTPARSFVALPSPSTSQKDDEEAEDFFSTLLQGQQTPAATSAAQPAVPPTPMSISPPPPPPSQRRVSFREPVDQQNPPPLRTVSDDCDDAPPAQTDAVLELVDSWGASPDAEARKLAQLRADETTRQASETDAASARKAVLEAAADRAEAEVSGMRRISGASPDEASRLTARRRGRRQAVVWSAGGSSSSDGASPSTAATTPAPTAPKRTDSAEARDFFAALGAPAAAEPAAGAAPVVASPEPVVASPEPVAASPEPAQRGLVRKSLGAIGSIASSVVGLLAATPEPEAPEAPAEAPAMPPLPETPVAAVSTKERTPDGARVVTTASGPIAFAPPPVEPSEMAGAVALPGLAAPARRETVDPAQLQELLQPTGAGADLPPPAPFLQAAAAALAPPVPPTPAVSQPVAMTTTARRNVVTSWGAATARRVPAVSSPKSSKTPAPANVVRGWGPAARSQVPEPPTPEANRRKAAAAAARRRSMAPAPAQPAAPPRKSSEGAPNFARRAARPARLSTDDQQLREAARARAALKARLAKNSRAVPGQAGAARRAATKYASPRRVVPKAPPAKHVRRGPTVAQPFTFGASRRQTVSFREPVSPPLAERLAKADAAVPSRWRKEPAPRTKRRQTLTTPASPALMTKNLRQKPLPMKRVEEQCTDFKARDLDPRILGAAGGCVGVPVVASRPATADAPFRLHATRAKPIAMSRDERELAKPAFRARGCPGGMAVARPATAPAQRKAAERRRTVARPFSARPAPAQKFAVAKSQKLLTDPRTPPMPGLVRHAQATRQFEAKKVQEAKALKRRQSRGLVLRERDSNTQNLDARVEKRKAYDVELKRRRTERAEEAKRQAAEASQLEQATLRRERMTPAAKGGFDYVSGMKRYGRHGSLTNPDEALVELTPVGPALVDYGTPRAAEASDLYAATPAGEAIEADIAQAVVEAC